MLYERDEWLPVKSSEIELYVLFGCNRNICETISTDSDADDVLVNWWEHFPP